MTRLHWSRFTVLGTLALVALATSTQGATRLTTSTGEAITSARKLLYREEGKLFWKDGEPQRAETIYYSADGSVIARLEASFEKNVFAPSFRLEDKRDGSWHESRLIEPGVLQVSRGKPDETTEVKRLELGKGAYAAGPGSVFFAREHFEKLRRGEDLTVKVVAPAYLDYFTFELSRERLQPDAMDVEMAISSFFIRLFAPKVRFSFHPETKRLLAYRGPSIIPDDRGKFHGVTVTYDEQTP